MSRRRPSLDSGTSSTIAHGGGSAIPGLDPPAAQPGIRADLGPDDGLVVGPARPGELERQQEAVVALLTSRYAAPPWSESPEELMSAAHHLAAEGGRHGVATAVARRHGRIVGLAQGGPGRAFADDLAMARPREDLEEWGPPAFELTQLLVAPGAEGQGVGSRLHDVVIRGVRLPALLLTHPEAAAALRLYDRRGWGVLGHLDVAPGHPRLVLGRRPGDHPPRVGDRTSPDLSSSP